MLRIDPDTNEVTLDISIDQPRSLVVGAGAVWITTASERIVRIEPSTGPSPRTIPVPAQAYAPVASRGTLWAVVGIGGGEIWRFDADTGSPTGTIRIGRFPVDLALAGGTLWVSHRSRSLGVTHRRCHGPDRRRPCESARGRRRSHPGREPSGWRSGPSRRLRYLSASRHVDLSGDDLCADPRNLASEPRVARFGLISPRPTPPSRRSQTPFCRCGACLERAP